MTTDVYLRQSTRQLNSSGIATSRLDSLILLEFALGIDRSKILANPNTVINPKQLNVLDSLMAKRSTHVPIAQLVNRTEFYGRDFYIDRRVLEPRPESETMIDMLKKLVKHSPFINDNVLKDGKSPNSDKSNKKISILDVGTGSGALGITSMLELPEVQVDLLDIDKDALKVAKKNVVLHTISTSIILSNLLDKTNMNYHILLCNLPYVPDGFHINLAASHERPLAIFGGIDGLNIYRSLFKSLSKRLHKPLYILTEALPSSHKQLASIASSANYKLADTEDFIQLYKYKG